MSAGADSVAKDHSGRNGNLKPAAMAFTLTAGL